VRSFLCRYQTKSFDTVTITEAIPAASLRESDAHRQVWSQTQRVSLAELTTESESCKSAAGKLEPDLRGTGVQATFYEDELRKLIYNFLGTQLKSCATPLPRSLANLTLDLHRGAIGQDNVGS
jgi:hypothetical protein